MIKIKKEVIINRKNKRYYLGKYYEPNSLNNSDDRNNDSKDILLNYFSYKFFNEMNEK